MFIFVLPAHGQFRALFIARKVGFTFKIPKPLASFRLGLLFHSSQDLFDIVKKEVSLRDLGHQAWRDNGGESAVDHQSMAVDALGGIGAEEEDGKGDLGGINESPMWDNGEYLLYRLLIAQFM